MKILVMIKEVCMRLARRAEERDPKAFRVVNHYGQAYLGRSRLHIAKPRLLRAYLHLFLLPDSDTEHHNHPWAWATAIVLSGGYWEERLHEDLTVTRRWLGPGSINVLRRSTYHRVAMLADEEVVTLFLVFGRNRDSWSFKHPVSGLVTPWRTFVQRHDRKIT